MSIDREIQSAAAAQTWDIPSITTPGALADWLALSIGELEWFADLKALGYKKDVPRLRHYRYRITSKRSGSIRLLEAPKPRLKGLQRKVLSGILEKVPGHPAAHGFIKGRSIKTFIAPHTGQRVVLRMDVKDFFASFAAARIQAFFQTIGYPEPVARLLRGICTNAVPRDVWRRPPLDIDPQQIQEARALYARPHLPQGSPASPALANLCLYRIDCRLAGLAKSAGAEYTRYADDLAFSGDSAFERCAERFSTHVAAILLEEGFRAHHRKTRIMRQGVRQHLAGLVINERMNIMRPDFDRLKATLTNCVRLGMESQNRSGCSDFRSHLEGHVAFVETIHPARGSRLRAILNRIQWPQLMSVRDNSGMPNEQAGATAIGSEAEQYKARLAAYVEGKDPIEIQRDTPHALARLVEGVPVEKLKQPPAPGKWSICAILAHLAEDEIASSWRYRQMIENSGTILPGFDQNEWARLGNYDSWKPEEALAMFLLLREANLRLFANLTAEEWQRFGMHTERGRMTVKDLATQMAGHDVNHIEQVRQILAGF